MITLAELRHGIARLVESQRHTRLDRLSDRVRSADNIEWILAELILVRVALPFELAGIEIDFAIAQDCTNAHRP